MEIRDFIIKRKRKVNKYYTRKETIEIRDGDVGFRTTTVNPNAARNSILLKHNRMCGIYCTGDRYPFYLCNLVFSVYTSGQNMDVTCGKLKRSWFFRFAARLQNWEYLVILLNFVEKDAKINILSVFWLIEFCYVGFFFFFKVVFHFKLWALEKKKKIGSH